MKHSFAILALFISITTCAQKNIDVVHYKYEIELNDYDDTIRGQAEIVFIVLAKNGLLATDELVFDLSNINGKDKKGMIVKEAYGITPLPGSSAPKAIHQNDKIRVVARRPIKYGDTGYVYITYNGIPSDGLIISKNSFGKRTFFGDNWPNRAHNWLPCVDDPADKASVEFIVTAPAHYQIISNGIQVEETSLPDNKKLTHYKEDVPLPTKVMVIGAADFAVNNIGDTNCIPVSSWVYAENRAEGFYDYAIGKDILGFFSNYIGPYPYKKLANVQSKTRFGGMENAGAIFYNESTVTGKREEERLFAHEIVHQWFGNMATEKSFAHLWLSEGFATYLTHIFLESKYGTDTLNSRMREEREEIIDFVKRSKRPVVDSTPNFMELLNANSYQKGSWVLHMLRRELGDSVFHKAIRT
ncbi:MAG TPA: M1 family metallopeptidase, partial [Chitinophagaceae bacterium]|nr:M1 family metallopeptidase [Chitinophagaceae bacterium]